MKGGDDILISPESQFLAFDQQGDPATTSTQENNVPQPVIPSAKHNTSTQQLFRYIKGQDQPQAVII